MRILVVEDEAKVRRFIEQALKTEGLEVESIDNLEELEHYLQEQVFDLIVLDRLLGKRDSLPMIPKIREKHPTCKILVLSALSEVDDRVSGLSMGADDYLAKPFHVQELVARIRVLGRREPSFNRFPKKMEALGVSVLLDQQEAFYLKKPLALSSKEFKLLILFMENPKKIFSRMDLLDRIWGMNFDPESNVVDVTINRLRTKIEEAGAPPLIHTKRGSGYWFGNEA